MPSTLMQQFLLYTLILIIYVLITWLLTCIDYLITYLHILSNKQAYPSEEHLLVLSIVVASVQLLLESYLLTQYMFVELSDCWLYILNPQALVAFLTNKETLKVNDCKDTVLFCRTRFWPKYKVKFEFSYYVPWLKKAICGFWSIEVRYLCIL